MRLRRCWKIERRRRIWRRRQGRGWSEPASFGQINRRAERDVIVGIWTWVDSAGDGAVVMDDVPDVDELQRMNMNK